ncbi:MAG: tryptophan synthase subunit alpha [Clostridia bacterium]|nr:tryptophan synthase subunit alpha [Clostridia bacterium]
MKNFRYEIKTKNVIPYIMIGENGIDESYRQFDYYAKKGCKLIEIGVPFSDPSADGPVIQRASLNAIAHGITFKHCLHFASECKSKSPDVKLILMTYLNPVYNYGLNNVFHHEGIDGLIIPDLPFEEYDLIRPYLTRNSVAFIPLISMDTPSDRIKDILSIGSGFIYLMAVKGITGSKNADSKQLVEIIHAILKESDLPVVAGFGIKSREQAVEMLKHTSGVIMASQLLKHWKEDHQIALDAIFK